MKNFYFLVWLSLLSFGLQAQISGTVFHDFNANGLYETGDPDYNEKGARGLTVTAFDASNTQVAIAMTSFTDGTYTLPGVSGNVRIEFTYSETWMYPGPSGGTSIGGEVEDYIIRVGCPAICLPGEAEKLTNEEKI